MGVCAAVVVALAVGAAACGEESQAEAEQNLCSSLASFGTAVVDFRQLDVGSTKDDIQDAADNVQSAWDDVKSDAQDVEQADESALDSAQSDLQSAVEDLPDDTTVAQAIPALEPQLQEVNQTLEEMSGGLNCAVSAVTNAETG
jgi:hypothetical protein